MALSKRGKKILGMAQSEAQIRYGPELAQLAGLKGEARGTYKTGVKQEKGISVLLATNARAARPVVKKDYAESDKTRVSARNKVKQDLAGLSAAADVFKGAAAVENQGAR